MTRRAICVMGAAVLMAGCSDRPTPLTEAKPLDTPPASGKALLDPPPGGKPDKSDPAAAAIVADALKAVTGGNPDVLRQLRSYTRTLNGRVRYGGLDMVQQTWVIHSAWPDRFRLKAEMPQGSQTIGWTGAAGWRHVGFGDKLPLNEQDVQDIRVEVTGEWLPLLFPLAEPDTIVAPAPDATVTDRPAVGVRVWNPRLSDAVVHFDKETKRVALVTFEGREGGRKVTKEVLVLASKAFLGVTLPEKTVVKSNGNPVAEWTMTGLEAVPNLDPKLLESP